MIVINKYYCVHSLHWWHLMVVVAFFGALCLADGAFALGVLVMGCIGLTSSGSWELTSPLLSGSLSFIATLNDISVSSINTVEHSSKYKDDTVTWSRWYRHINFNVTTKPSHLIKIQLLCTLHYSLINLTWNLSQLWNMFCFSLFSLPQPLQPMLIGINIYERAFNLVYGSISVKTF